MQKRVKAFLHHLVPGSAPCMGVVGHIKSIDDNSSTAARINAGFFYRPASEAALTQSASIRGVLKIPIAVITDETKSRIVVELLRLSAPIDTLTVEERLKNIVRNQGEDN